MASIILILFSLNSSYFLKLSPGVKSQGLGGVSLMIDEGLCAFHNPALTSSTKINFMLSRWLYSTNYLCLGASYKDYVLGISYLNYGQIQGYDQFGLETEEFTPYNACLAFGRKIGLFGIVIKSFEEKIDEEILYGACIALSSYIDIKNISLGVKIDNLGKEFAKNTSIPINSTVGIKYSFNKFDIIVESNVPDLEICSGIAYTHKNLCLLFGIKYLSPLNLLDHTDMTPGVSDIHLSSGLIISIDEYQIGYSFLYNSISTGHRFSILLSP
jgi:hypothetical protein